jgi:hypothetical protein
LREPFRFWAEAKVPLITIRGLQAISLYFGKIPTELDAEQVQDYLFYQQKSPCLAGRPVKPLRKRILNIAFTDFVLLKSEGLPYEFLRLPSIKHEKKLPVVLSKEEVWAIQNAKLLKHRILIGLLYGAADCAVWKPEVYGCKT